MLGIFLGGSDRGVTFRGGGESAFRIALHVCSHRAAFGAILRRASGVPPIVRHVVLITTCCRFARFGVSSCICLEIRVSRFRLTSPFLSIARLHIVLLFIAAALFCAIPSAARAQTLQWDGSLSGTGYSDLSGNWDSTTGNWYNPLLPGDQDWISGDTAAFGSGSGSGTYTITLDSGNIAAAGIVFNADPGAFTFAGTSPPTLSLGAGGITMASGSGAETFGSTLNIALTAGQIWTNNNVPAGSALTVNSGITSSAVGGLQTLSFGGTGNTTIGGVIGNGATGGTVGLTMNGSGTLALNGANTFTGLLRINSGIVSTTNFATVGTVQGIGQAATLALTAARSSTTAPPTPITSKPTPTPAARSQSPSG